MQVVIDGRLSHGYRDPDEADGRGGVTRCPGYRPRAILAS